MTLLTPAVLHSSALEYIKDQDSAFHKRYVLKFGLVQGLWGVIFFLLCLAFLVIPSANRLQNISTKILSNANFSSVSINSGVMAIDIKPAIWTFSISDSSKVKQAFVVDTTGNMNRYYWDDRVEKGEIKQINGIAFMKDYLFVKYGVKNKKISYNTLTMGRKWSLSKEELHKKILAYTDRNTVVKAGLVLLPMVFLISSVMGVLVHAGYILLVGTILSLLTKTKNTPKECYAIASGLYVGFAYVLITLIVAEVIVTLSLGNISNFFVAIKSILFVVFVFIGYLSLTTGNTSMKRIQKPIIKVKSATND